MPHEVTNPAVTFRKGSGEATWQGAAVENSWAGCLPHPSCPASLLPPAGRTVKQTVCAASGRVNTLSCAAIRHLPPTCCILPRAACRHAFYSQHHALPLGLRPQMKPSPQETAVQGPGAATCVGFKAIMAERLVQRVWIGWNSFLQATGCSSPQASKVTLCNTVQAGQPHLRDRQRLQAVPCRELHARGVCSARRLPAQQAQARVIRAPAPS